MSLIHPGILYGLGLAAIPIVLHLLLRPKPKKLLFPALRLVQSRRKTNVRRLRLRHLWLLLLRIAVLALIVLAISRPSLPAADYGPNARELLTLGGIIATTIAAYAALLALWRRRPIPQHVFTYRRSLLRAAAAIAAVLLAMLFVGWPYGKRVAADWSDETTVVSEEMPAAVVFLIDTSLSMSYELENRTRLDAAREVARTHMARLPGRSRIAILDSSRTDTLSATIFHADRSAARSRMESLSVSSRGLPLNDALRGAIRLQEIDRTRHLDDAEALDGHSSRDPYHREVYIFTDLARSAWRDDAGRRLMTELERVPWLRIYLIDVGAEEPRNASVANIRLSGQAVSENADVSVTAEVSVQGMSNLESAVELLVGAGPDAPRVTLGRTTVGGGKEEVGFTIDRATGSLVQGELRLTSTDPFPADDVGYFTVRVQPPPDVLIVSENPNESHYWRTALEAVGAKCRETKPAELAELEAAELAIYEAVCLMSVRSPTEETWSRLRGYVDAGGGLCVFLGAYDIDELAYDGELPRSFLPASLQAPRPYRREPAFLAFPDRTHPLLRKFQPPWGLGDLVTRPIFWCWNVEPAADAHVIGWFTNDGAEAGLPAVIERGYGGGRTLMFTTAVDRGGWSELPLAGWWFVALADQSIRYASGQGLAQFNYVVGEPVTIPLDANRPSGEYLLREPGAEGRQFVRQFDPEATELMISAEDATQPGHYRILPTAGEDSEFDSGFSINPPPGESDFSRLETSELDALFGEDRYQVARDPNELESIIIEGRVGQEMYSAVLVFLLLFFCGEMLVSNRFYGDEEGTLGTRD